MRRYVIADVFTQVAFAGNPVAVVLDAEDLSEPQMLAIAREFNYSETTFVLPARDPANAAQVRIFTPSREVPFAGHPNLGTAAVLAWEAARAGQAPPRRLVFEEAAGNVTIDLHPEGAAVAARLAAPEPLSRGSEIGPDDAAACLSLSVDDVRSQVHAPQVASVGLPFLVVELHAREALRRASPNAAAFRRTLPVDGATAIYVYVRGDDPSGGALPIHARMFTPRLTEDPATGSATAATAGLLLACHPDRPGHLRLRAVQGEDMGRPSQLEADASVDAGGAVRATVGGFCVEIMRGTILSDGPTDRG